MMNFFSKLTIALLFLFFSCQSNELELDHQLLYQDETVSIELTGIEDSRCPTDVVCVWAGNVKADMTFTWENDLVTDFTIYYPGGPETDTIYPGSITINDYQITIEDVQPYPEQHLPLPEFEEYRISLQVIR